MKSNKELMKEHSKLEKELKTNKILTTVISDISFQEFIEGLELKWSILDKMNRLYSKIYPKGKKYAN